MVSGDVGVLVLAAGVSRRFGSDKRFFELDGVPLLQLTLENALASGLQVRLCHREIDGEVSELAGSLAVECLACDRSVEGMGATLAQGIVHCEDWRGCLVALGDMAWVEADSYRALADALAPGAIVRPTYRGQAGNPVCFDRVYYPEMRELTGDIGARQILGRHPEVLELLELNDPGVLRDLDSPPV